MNVSAHSPCSRYAAKSGPFTNDHPKYDIENT
jgi:hypothetical protein